MDQKLAFVGPEILVNSKIPVGTVAFMPPRRTVAIEGFREISRNETGVTFALEYLVESEADWMKRGCVLYNVAVE